jgi:Major capsid protein Gp23
MNRSKYLIEENAERRQKWAYLTEGLVTDKRLQCEVLLDNTQRFLSEASTLANVGAFATFAFPMIRRIFPKLIAQTLCSVQPMTQPTGKVFWLDFKYGTTKGTISANDRLDQAGNLAGNYADRAPETGEVAEINFDIASDTVSAEEKALKAQWTIEAQQDLKAYHGLDAESELMVVLSDEIIREIDMLIIASMVANATAGNVNWNINAPSELPWTNLDPKVYKATLYDAIVDANNLVFKKRYRNCTWVVADADTCTRLEKLEGFKLTETVDDAIYNIGIHQFGVLRNRWIIYKHPWFQANKMLLGFKGASWMDTGYVYAPYIPLYTTPLIVHPDTFKPIRGMMSRYGRKMINGDCFATVTLVSS